MLNPARRAQNARDVGGHVSTLRRVVNRFISGVLPVTRSEALINRQLPRTRVLRYKVRQNDPRTVGFPGLP